MRSTQLSIVVPVYNEEGSVDPLYSSIVAALDAMPYRYEILFTDDGSTDATLARLQEILSRDPRVRIVHFRRNFGQTTAMRTGILRARGKYIITLDGDLQNDPRDIPLFIERLEAGDDLVIGWRRDRQDPILSRTLPSRMANWLICWITGVKIHDSGCSLKGYRASMIKSVPLYSEMHRFIPAMSTLRRAKISEVVVQHHARQFGKSKYGLSRVGKVLLDMLAIKMLISFSERPLHWFARLSIPFWGLALLTTTYSFFQYLTGSADATYVSPIAAILFFYMALHFVFVGFIAELIIRRRPTF